MAERASSSTSPVRGALRTPPGQLALLAGVFLGALALRVWGSGFGLPHIYHADEGFEVYRAVRLGMLDFDFDRVGKGGYYFLLFVEYGVYFLIRLLTGAATGVDDFATQFVADPSPFWRIGRTTTAVLGALTTVLVWFQGRRIAGSRAGILGALFLAVSTAHAFESHYIVVDVPMALWAFLALIMIAEDAAGRSRIRLWWFAPVAAYAVMNKMPAALIFLPYFMASMMRGGLFGRGGLATRATWIPVGVAAVIYCVGNPGIVVNFATESGRVVHTLTGAADPDGEFVASAERGNLWAFYGGVLLRSQGPALLALSLLGMGLVGWRRDRAALVHVAFVLPYFVLLSSVGTSHLYYPRYVVPLLPGLCLLAGIGLDEIVRRVGAAPRIAAATCALTALCVVIEPGIAVARWDAHMTRTDTRTKAARWVESNVPHRARILLEGFPEDDSQLAVPLRTTRKNAKDIADRLRDTDPGKSRFWDIKRDTLEPPLYDLVTVRHFEPWPPLAAHLAEGVEYAIVRREFFSPGSALAVRLPGDAQATRHAFYGELREYPGAEILASFDARRGDAPGFDIEIWRLAPVGASAVESR